MPEFVKPRALGRKAVRFGRVSDKFAGVVQRGELLEVAFRAELSHVQSQTSGIVDGKKVDVVGPFKQSECGNGLIEVSVREVGSD